MNGTGAVVTIGECMACLTSTGAGPLHAAQSFTLSSGGSESNVAIGLARLGHAVTWVSRLGDDDLGRLILGTVTANGVHALVHLDRDAPTGLMLKARRLPGVSRVSYYRASSAASLLTAADVPCDLVASARLLHVTGITPALGAGPAAAVMSAVECARDHGVPISFDVNYRASLWGKEEAAAALFGILEASDIVFASPHEAELFVSAGVDDLPAALAAFGPSQVVLKLGSAGALAVVDGVHLRQSAYPAEEIDPVGAGDGFVAGYLSEYLRGTSPGTRLDTAARAGALVVMVDGDWEGLPRREELRLLDASDAVLR